MSNTLQVQYAVATLTDGTELANPFWRIDSGRAGPCLGMIASQHGNEVQGAEVARRFAQVCAEQLVAGSVCLVPFGNLRAVRARRHSHDLGPEQPGRFSQGHNIQQLWPGDPQGNDTERAAYALDQATIRHWTHAMDMHCWNHFWGAATLGVSDHEPSRALAEVTTPRFAMWRPASPPSGPKMMFGQLLRERGAATVCMELSGQFQIVERQVQIGLSSMVNIARTLGMLPGEPQVPENSLIPITEQSSHAVVAPCAGLFVAAALAPDDWVEEGQPLGHLISDRDLDKVVITAPVSGWLWKFGCHRPICDASLPDQHPYAEEGDMLALIVTPEGGGN